MIAGIKSALLETGRTIDEDHYGAAFAFRFGGPDDPGVAKVMDHYRARTGRDPRDMFAMGDADVILQRLSDYIAAGASKFILRPIADGRYRHARPDPPSGGGSPAAGRHALAQGAESGRLSPTRCINPRNRSKADHDIANCP